jgi:hypothetical protein
MAVWVRRSRRPVGVAHVLPTARVVCAFSGNSREKRLVIKHEWIAEAMTTWFLRHRRHHWRQLGGSHHASADWVYRALAVMLRAGSGCG